MACNPGRWRRRRTFRPACLATFAASWPIACLETDTIQHGEVLHAVHTGDVDGDGLPDLILASDYDARVGTAISIRLSDGRGAFGAPIHTSLEVPSRPGSLAAGDFNGDGNLDVIAADAATYVLHVLLGDGTGRFARMRIASPCDDPRALAAADLNADGLSDIAVACGDDGGAYLGVLFGARAGPPRDPKVYMEATGTVAFAVAIGDIDNDGSPDVVTSGLHNGAQVRVHLNDGDGNLTPLAFVPGGLTDVTVADLDGDEYPDVIAAERDRVVWHRGGESGLLGPAKRLTAATQVSALAVTGIGPGSQLDVVVARSDAAKLAVYWGSAEASFVEQSIALPRGAKRLLHADFDADGWREIVAVHDARPGELTILWSETR